MWKILCGRLIKTDEINDNDILMAYYGIWYQKQKVNGFVCSRGDFNGIMTHRWTRNNKVCFTDLILNKFNVPYDSPVTINRIF